MRGRFEGPGTKIKMRARALGPGAHPGGNSRYAALTEMCLIFFLLRLLGLRKLDAENPVLERGLDLGFIDLAGDRQGPAGALHDTGNHRPLSDDPLVSLPALAS